MKLLLKTLRLIGVRKNYEVHFHKGLNYISGPTSTGKTAILELIDYAFGKKNHKSYIDQRISIRLKDHYQLLKNLFFYRLTIVSKKNLHKRVPWKLIFLQTKNHYHTFCYRSLI